MATRKIFLARRKIPSIFVFSYLLLNSIKFNFFLCVPFKKQLLSFLSTFNEMKEEKGKKKEILMSANETFYFHRFYYGLEDNKVRDGIFIMQ